MRPVLRIAFRSSIFGTPQNTIFATNTRWASEIEEGALQWGKSAIRLPDRRILGLHGLVYTAEVARGLSARTVIRLFEQESGVLIRERPETMHKRRYRSIRIPRGVYESLVPQPMRGLPPIPVPLGTQ